MENGTNRVFLNTDDKRAVIALDYNGEKNQWLVTAYKIDTPRPAYPHKSEAHGDDFSTSSAVSNSDIIPQKNNQSQIFELIKNGGGLLLLSRILTIKSFLLA